MEEIDVHRLEAIAMDIAIKIDETSSEDMREEFIRDLAELNKVINYFR